MFLTERELRDVFWKNYNYSNRACKYQFECPIREGNADLVTAEIFQDRVQLNAFEFKLEDIKKAILQAKADVPFVNKAWIVIPSEKEKLINDRYLGYLKETKTVGVITVETGGRWKMIYRPYFQSDIRVNQTILKMLISKI